VANMSPPSASTLPITIITISVVDI
jgi:hypothetical protein